jgi:hypothetical protein
MSEPYNRVSLFGIGGLLTQRKTFQVPAYQRNFAWSRDIVEQFVYDITSALENNERNYFIGMVVLTGPQGDAWQLLEGQQRLATTILIYSAIKRVLNRLNQQGTAEQIKTEFIVARKLSGELSPRLILNDVNQELFSKLILEDYSDDELRRLLNDTRDVPSNRRLIEAAITCGTLISQYALEGKLSEKESADRLFDLVYYLESKVTVACFDVSSEESAFTIFHTLNNRGVSLSVVDLIKSYLFNKAGKGSFKEATQDWNSITLNVGNRGIEEFLKLFWISRYGNVRTIDLFENVKSRVDEGGNSLQLLNDLANTSSYFAALHDPAHEIWAEYSPKCREHIQTLNLLGANQVKPIIFSAIKLFNAKEMARLLWVLIVLAVRSQIVGRRSVGRLSRYCGSIANEIYRGDLKTSESVLNQLQDLIVPDEVFYNDFLSFGELKASRAAYFLLELESTYRKNTGHKAFDWQVIEEPHKAFYVDHILPLKFNTSAPLIDQSPMIANELLQLLGNQCLVENSINLSLSEQSFAQKARDYYAQSEVFLTKRLAEEGEVWGSKQIQRRQAQLAQLSVETWTVTATA